MAEKTKVRIVSATVGEAEKLINELSEEYSPIVWNIGPVEGRVMVTVVMLHESEMQKLRAAQAPAMGLPLDLGRLRGLR